MPVRCMCIEIKFALFCECCFENLWLFAPRVECLLYFHRASLFFPVVLGVVWFVFTFYFLFYFPTLCPVFVMCLFVCWHHRSLFLCMFVYQFVSLSRFPPFYIFFLSSLRLCDPFFSPSSFLPPFFGSLWPFDLTSPGRLCCLADDPTAVRSTTWTTWGHLHLS